MSALDILRRITKPMTDTESVALVTARYGVGRENVSNDDPLAAQRAKMLLERRKRFGAHVRALKAKKTLAKLKGKAGSKKLGLIR